MCAALPRAVALGVLGLVSDGYPSGAGLPALSTGEHDPARGAVVG
ncbi:hypothetical protein ABZ738_18070 [Micromonospora sp. NPDC047793]